MLNEDVVFSECMGGISNAIADFDALCAIAFRKRGYDPIAISNYGNDCWVQCSTLLALLYKLKLIDIKEYSEDLEGITKSITDIKENWRDKKYGR